MCKFKLKHRDRRDASNTGRTDSDSESENLQYCQWFKLSWHSSESETSDALSWHWQY